MADRFSRSILLVAAALTLVGCQSARCEVHGDPLVSQRVPIVYGLMDGDYLEDRREFFPRANVLGGCMVDDTEDGTRVVRCCATCQEVEAAWDGAGMVARRSFDTFNERDRLLDR